MFVTMLSVAKKLPVVLRIVAAELKFKRNYVSISKGFEWEKLCAEAKKVDENSDELGKLRQELLSDEEEEGMANNLIRKLTLNVQTLADERNFLRDQNVSIMDKYSRVLIEIESLRARLTKQIKDAKQFGIQNFSRDLLEVADVLGHATAAVPVHAINADNPHLKNLFVGLVTTQACLLQTFQRHGLQQLNPINERFDPNFHEALFERDDDNVEPNTVIEVTKFGYKLHERLLRPALVGVSKWP